MDKKTAWVTFAAAALQGLNANPELTRKEMEDLVVWASEAADMMLKEYGYTFEDECEED